MDVRDRLPIVLNDRHFEIDLPYYRRRALDVSRTLVDQNSEGGEATLNNEYVWKRTVDDWSLGGGQEQFDAYEDLNRRRFDTSWAVDCWTRGECKPLPGATLALSMPGFERIQMVTGSNRVVIGQSTASSWSIRRVIDASQDQWDLEATPIASGTSAEPLKTMVTDGRYLYYTSSGRLWRCDIASGYTSTRLGGSNTFAVDRVFFVGDRLICSIWDPGGIFGARLAEVKADTLDYIAAYEPTVMPVFVASAGGPNCVYLAGHSRVEVTGDALAGMRSTIYRLGINDENGELIAPQAVTTLPEGELVNTMTSYGGFVVLGTTKGIRVCAINTTTGALTYGPVIEIPGDRSTVYKASPYYEGWSGVTALEPEGQYVWFSWAYQPFGETGLGRLDLARFTDDLVPAYATDLAAPYMGRVASIITYDTERVWTVIGTGVIVERSGRWPNQRTFTTGEITYGTDELKRLTSIEVASTVVPTGWQIDVYLTTPDGSQGLMGTVTAGQKIGKFTVNIAAEWFDVQLVWTRVSTAEWVTPPTVKRVTLRATPLPQRLEEIWLPIVVADTVTVDSGTSVALDTWAEFEWLRTLMTSRLPVQLQMGSELIAVIVDDVITGIDDSARMDSWNDTGSWPEGVWMVKCVTVEADAVDTQIAAEIFRHRYVRGTARYSFGPSGSKPADAERGDFHIRLTS